MMLFLSGLLPSLVSGNLAERLELEGIMLGEEAHKVWGTMNLTRTAEVTLHKLFKQAKSDFVNTNRMRAEFKRDVVDGKLKLVPTKKAKQLRQQIDKHGFEVDEHTCLKDGQCYNGDHPDVACCKKRSIQNSDSLVECTGTKMCDLCQASVRTLTSYLSGSTCGAVLIEVSTMCLAATGGNPFGTAPCTLLMMAFCSAVYTAMEKLEKKAINSQFYKSVCMELDYCDASDTNDGSASSIFGRHCGCIESGQCTLHESGCCEGLKAVSAPWSCFTGGFHMCTPK